MKPSRLSDGDNGMPTRSDTMFAAVRSGLTRQQRDHLLSRPVWSSADGVIFATSHSACRSVLRQPEARSQSEAPAGNGKPRAESNPNLLLFSDGEQHRRLRSLIVTNLNINVDSPITMDRARELASETIRSAGDFACDWVAPLSAEAACRALGLPLDRCLRLLPQMRTAAGALDPGASEQTVLDGRSAGVQCLTEMGRAASRPETLHGVARALVDEYAAGRLDHRTCLSNLVSLLAAALDTTQAMLGAAVAAFDEHPSIVQLVARKPSDTGLVVEELLRWGTPVKTVVRYAPDTNILDGLATRSGQPIVVLLCCANFDPTVYRDPDQFDPKRESPPPTLAFGAGAHRCIGAAIAREVAATALRGLADAWTPSIELTRVPREHAAFGGYDTIRVR